MTTFNSKAAKILPARLLAILFAGIATANLAATTLRAADDETGFEFLTDASAPELWTGYDSDYADKWPATWKFEDGVLHALGGGVDLKTRREYSDFDLRFEWKAPAGANSGVMYRVSQETDPAFYTGPEYQIIDKPGSTITVTPAMETGAVYDLYAPTKDVSKPAGEWNSSRIVVTGNRVEHYLNGELVASCEIGSDDWNQRVAASKFDAWKKFGRNRSGHIVLQDHGNEVWFRNVRIKALDDAAQGK